MMYYSSSLCNNYLCVQIKPIKLVLSALLLFSSLPYDLIINPESCFLSNCCTCAVRNDYEMKQTSSAAKNATLRI